MALTQPRTSREPGLLPQSEAVERMRRIPRWKLENKVIRREFRFASFDEAIEFANEVARVARAQEHHPDLCVYYDKVRVELSTHKVGGLTARDFELAAMIDELAS